MACKTAFLLLCTLAMQVLVGAHDTEVDAPRFIQCGGTIQSDSGSLTFPEAGTSIIPGDICVWTIHLDTLDGFRLNFTNLAISSNTTDCQSAGLRIYSLTNLVPAGNQESYRFCDEEPPSSTFFLGKSVATVVFYTSPETNPSDASGFTLNWEGAGFNPLRTKHLSSFTTTTSAAIQYPVVGGYESNLAATWLVKADTIDSTPVDLNLKNVNFESCDLPNPCFCDALILYEVTAAGIVIERDRFCGNNSTPILLEQVSSKFILAFFTDMTNPPAASGGFDLVYYPTPITTTEEPTTTEIATTVVTDEPTTTQRPGESTICGETLKVSSGRIAYKVNTTYDRMERCIWTIRIPSFASNIHFKLISGPSSGYDTITTDTFWIPEDSDDPDQMMHETHGWDSPGENVMKGTVAIIYFATDISINGDGFGFELEFFASDQQNATGVNYFDSKDYLGSGTSGNIRHPDGSGPYSNYELTTFILPFRGNMGVVQQPLPWLSLKVLGNSGAMEGNCNDQLRIYRYTRYHEGLKLNYRLCYEDIYPREFDSGINVDNGITVVIFLTDSWISTEPGFWVDWTWVENGGKLLQ